MRAVRSAEPPAPNGTTSVTARCGQLSCACAAAETMSAIAAASVFCMFQVPQYDRGSPNTFSAMKFKIMWGVTGAIRVIRDSRR